ncbi:alpha/beta hydrolase [Puniceicoccales bacterium CK1056]|uniref:Alpha/beta hydrolase n=1 Tax=Oceanipulchritudo coccoides TaxID=2706888 RepID=A0A6B2M164_9BACT|nr:alpha/beta hydrolase [Oceanipulchritudo coccoides]NDV62106.1 alpha/beta hydrolase [Oceanipulchritudo coccoides]
MISYIGLAGFAFLFANKLVFPAPPPGYSDSPDLLKFTYNEEGNQVSMVFLENKRASRLVFYHHGNGEDLQSILQRLQVLREMGFAVLAWDYPGYGTSDGKPSERLVNEIARGIFNSIPEQFGYDTREIILYGRSVGGGPAVALAAREKVAGLILEGVFTSVFRVGIRYNILPWDIFDNLALIENIRCPVLFLHGSDDRVVPFSHGKALMEKAPKPKFFSWFSGGGHNDLIESYPESYYSSIRRFTEFLNEDGDSGQ